MSLHLTLQTADDPTLQQLIAQQPLTLADVLRLKAESAKFYRTDSVQARRIAEQSLRLSRLLPAPALAYGQWTLANALIYEEDYQGAARLFAEARPVLLAHDLVEDCARMSVGYVIALAYGAQARQGLEVAAESMKFLQQAAQRDVSDAVRLVNLLMNTGVCHELLGEYEEALQVTEQQLTLAKQLDDVSLEAQIRLNRAATLLLLNAFDLALVELSLAEPIFQTDQAYADLLRLYTNQSQILALQSRFREAFIALDNAYLQVIQLDSDAKGQYMLTRIRVALTLSSNTPITEQLLEEIKNSLQAFATYGPMYEECLMHLHLGNCYARLYNIALAEASLLRAYQLAQGGAEQVLSYMALYSLGVLAVQEGKFHVAINFFRQAIHVIDIVRSPLRIDLFRSGFLSDKLAVYHDLTAAYLATNQREDAFHVVEETKARLLSEKLSYRMQTHPSQPDNGEESAMDEREVTLRTMLVNAFTKLDHLYQQREILRQHKNDRQNTREQSAQLMLQQEIHEAEQHVTSFVNELQRNYAQYGSLEFATTSSLTEISQSLAQTIYLQYHLIHQDIWLFIIDHQGIQYQGRLCSLTDLEPTCQLWEASIAHVLGLVARLPLAQLDRFAPQLNQEAQKHLACLYDHLIRPIEAWLPPHAPLLISPDDRLHSLPFHAFYDRQSYLIEKHAITYTPSATVWAIKQKQPHAPGRWLFLGFAHQNLHGVEQEIQAIHTLLDQANRQALETETCHEPAYFLQAEATTTTFLEQVPSSSLIHLAAHAHFRLDQPMLSSITLADRGLTLAEISRLQLNANLVVLSACETGRGQLHGADFISLAAGFLGAGARALLVSLWRTEDQMAARLMVTFYQALLDQCSVTQALRTAILSLLTDSSANPATSGIVRHPAFWAPFVVIGDGSVRMVGESS